MENIDNKILEFLKDKPAVEAIYGYGSGVFEQDGSNIGTKQIDLILVVKNMKEWHKENIEKNPKDYSLMGKVFLSNYGHNILSSGTEITYLPYLNHNNDLFKIGVISEKNFFREMVNWRTTYFIAGRFQKLVKPIKSTEECDHSIAENRKKALIIGLRQLMFKPIEEQNVYNLLESICALSFIGDNRMLFAEDPNKIRNIISKSYNELKEIYKNSDLYIILEDDSIIINRERLSTEFVDNFMSYYLFDLPSTCIDSYFKALNQEDSWRQTLKGVLTAGPVKSTRYLKDKVLKKINSK